jgi:two-component system, cell cycle sensor histidine kinase and response regulator CckA
VVCREMTRGPLQGITVTMQITMRITGMLCAVAVSAGALLLLLASVNLIRIDLLPLLLFAVLMLGGVFVLCLVLVETPLRTLLKHLEKKDIDGLRHFSGTKGDFGRLAKLTLGSMPETVPDTITPDTVVPDKEPDEKKQIMEQQLRAVYKMEALGQLARGIAHDLNNSLGAISGYVELLKKTVPPGDERTQRYISMIASASQRSGGIIHQLLTYARKNHMQIISFDVNEVISDITKLLESSLDKNISLVQALNAKDAAIVGDPGQIQNSIVNLAINARDAMAAAGGTLTFKTENIVIDESFARSRPYKMTTGYYLMVSVSDTGVGMDKPTLGHLFEPFFTTKELGKGTGLGLASVYGSLKSHHGYIEVDSEVGHGSTFTMYLPVNQTVAEEETVNSEPASPAAQKRHIMIVDDDRSLIEMLGELLSWLGYSVTPFLTAAAAIEHYSTHHREIDLSILDWKMPGIDGMECYRRMKAINPGLKVLLSTGFCLDDERLSILDEGINGILPKPFMSAQLSSAIAEVLTQKSDDQSGTAS